MKDIDNENENIIISVTLNPYIFNYLKEITNETACEVGENYTISEQIQSLISQHFSKRERLKIIMKDIENGRYRDGIKSLKKMRESGELD